MNKVKFALLGVAALGIAACGAYSLTTGESGIAQLGAMKYAQALGGTLLSCSGQDSDDDGYVTCTVKQSDQIVKALLCSYKSEGCKDK